MRLWQPSFAERSVAGLVAVLGTAALQEETGGLSGLLLSAWGALLIYTGVLWTFNLGWAWDREERQARAASLWTQMLGQRPGLRWFDGPLMIVVGLAFGVLGLLVAL